MLHPSREDPANHSLMFMEYANSDSCSYRNRVQHTLYLGLALQLQ
jgi:hypothetical protein